eukprot:TRINITY_DN7739_c0_g1_i1.p1 TRINITY_DN7739_c0_g1~~TRINITY_DN7739_c0_g1_i1.p1  ORF type:complete len:422 (+),score=99.93 TRINITY_DN7739_c0_g1_i1:95-1267(+)
MAEKPLPLSNDSDDADSMALLTPPTTKTPPVNNNNVNMNNNNNAKSEHALLKIDDVWIHDVVSRLSGWLNYFQFYQPLHVLKMFQSVGLFSFYQSSVEPKEGESESSEEELWADWEWILNKTEEFCLQKKTEESQTIQKEIQHLRESGNLLKIRPIFLKQAKEAITLLPQEETEELQSTILDSNLRNSIISKLVHDLEGQWLNFVKETFFLIDGVLHDSWNKYLASYEESAYSKNVVGALKDSAFLSSHGPGYVGLSATILGDILWSIYNTLQTSIKAVITRDLQIQEKHLLIEQVLRAQTPLIELWRQTVKNSRFGLAHQGLLISRWKEEQEKENQRLKQIKQRGADAKWEFKGSLIDSYVQLNQKKPDMKDLRKTLEKSLQFRINTKY